VPLQALGVYATFRALGFGAVDVYKAIGRPGLAAGVSFARLIVLVPVLIAATSFGIEGVAWAQAALAFVFAVLMQSLACRMLDVPVRALWPAVRPGLAVGVGVAAGITAVRLGLTGSEALELAAAVPAGAIGALLLLWTTDRGFLREMRLLVPHRGRLLEPASA
jgi:PST family polysaccharide transporter